MAYFSHAFKKVFVTLGGGANPALAMEALSAGMFGFYDASTWAPVAVASATVTAHPKVVFVMHNPYHGVGADKQGVHGGFTESVKSQVIEARNIHRFWKIKPRHGRPQLVMFGWDGVDIEQINKFTCGQTLMLRLDLKGTTVLRFLGHNASRYYSVSTPCCTDPLHPTPIDPVLVMFDFAKQIREDPIMGRFISVDVMTLDPNDWSTPITVYPESYVPWTDPLDIMWVVAGLRMVAASTETEFNPLSFELTDHYTTEPLVITSAELVNDKGVRCPNFNPLSFTEVLAPLMPQGTPAEILRDLLSFIAYRQELYTKSARLRAVKDLEKIVVDINQHSSYCSYYILHSVPRKNNPSGVHDKDQYLLQIVFAGDDGSSMTYLENWMASYLSSAGNGVVLEDLTGEMDGT